MKEIAIDTTTSFDYKSEKLQVLIRKNQIPALPTNKVSFQYSHLCKKRWSPIKPTNLCIRFESGRDRPLALPQNE
ncbi:hypothetical protein [Leptospira idonii]|uniref:hypothetical protein n=1 Tax=Leptospira idonii TaxID=1193500 RepID=UPI0014385A52|nr:hypothetical protein [Leptospira idonii]